ncbi:hypothetical protein [Holdemania massiliensis]|uniref:hypothetical protein n=1 Tax=Holdemania massiliensis TaxID=1468449 RepID=UPI001F06E809|nr:hypothetical protein [Holdemania massiliensis]MCH1942796.1 hypothetical protein [Holdemania massiliensis]
MTREEWKQACRKNVFGRFRFYLIAVGIAVLIAVLAVMRRPGQIIVMGLAGLVGLVLIGILLLLAMEFRGIDRMAKTLPESLGLLCQLNYLWLGEEKAYYWFRRRGYTILYEELVSCSIAPVSETPYASGSADDGMLILGLKDQRSLSVNLKDKDNAVKAAQYLKTKNPRLVLADINEKQVSLEEIHNEG